MVLKKHIYFFNKKLYQNYLYRKFQKFYLHLSYLVVFHINDEYIPVNGI